ncbi:MAG TPA: hypothetical protein VFC44_18375 [Candidatus Saccharimonadales bacterium]|nr:hypothetical protein [Candidatus Saccharimonadales bacterium]
MKYVPDKTGRFQRRPHYEVRELDDECEGIITEFLKTKHGDVRFPITTDDLTCLIERDAADLDLYADLSEEGAEVQGVTDFFPKRKPRVRISRELSENPLRENRLRTTLTHEYGHVRFHDYVWKLDLNPADMLDDLPSKVSPKCNRNGLLNAPATDWMEWQAGYISGALLMPISAVRRLFSDYSGRKNVFAPIVTDSQDGRALRELMVKTFKVSDDAARVRLLKLRFFSDCDMGPSLL